MNGEKRLKIKISEYFTFTSPETINKGLFSKKYVVYKLNTAPFKYEVKRRFSDFMWLRSILIREYPTNFVILAN